MTKALLLCLALAPTLATAQEGAATVATSEASAPATAPYYTAGGEAKTLPENVLRFRLPIKFLRGEKAYDEDGKSLSLPVDISVNAGAFVLEYGVSDRLSLQLKTNFFMSQSVKGKSDQDILKSDMVEPGVASNKDALLNFIASKMATINGSGCTTVAACRTSLAGGFKLPQDYPVTTPTGEQVVIPANVPWQNVAEAYVENAAVEKVKDGEKTGKSGIGDTDVGALYAILTKEESPVALSVGGGIRIPTGTMVVDADQIPTGRGTTDLGIRLNVDYPPVPGIMLSFQNQTEVMLLKGKAGTSDSKLDIERTGLRNIGFLKMALGLGMFNQSIAPLGLYSSYNYDLDSKAKIDGEYVVDKAPRSYTVTFGTTLDGLALRIPVQLELEYEMSVGGRNTNALNSVGTTLKAFYRF